TRIDRNFSTSIGAPPRPTRHCLKKIGPGLDSLVAMAATRRSGEARTRTVLATVMSSDRLATRAVAVDSGGLAYTRRIPQMRSVDDPSGQTPSSKNRGTT